MARYGVWEGSLSSKAAVYPAPRIKKSIAVAAVKTFELVTSLGRKQWSLLGQVNS